MGRLKVTGYVDTDELQAEATDGDGKVSVAAFEEVRGWSVDDLEDLTVEEED